MPKVIEYFCDRCKEKIGMRDVTKIIYNDYIYDPTEFYLCYNCNKDFEKFMRNKKGAKEVKND